MANVGLPRRRAITNFLITGLCVISSALLSGVVGCNDHASETSDAGLPTDGGGADSGSDDGGTPLTCMGAVTSFCDRISPCVSTWADVEALSCQQPPGGGINIGSCGGYDVLSTFSTDQGSRAYFDASTGSLVAVVQFNSEPPSASCNLPEMKFVNPTDCRPTGRLAACDGGS